MTHLEQVEKKLLDIFGHKTKGFFVDVGAHDGISINNTKMLESLGWEGICIEPHPKVFQRLIQNRKCKSVNCVAIYDAIIATFKLLYDLVFVCFKKKT
jgi:hypothetical protein